MRNLSFAILSVDLQLSRRLTTPLTFQLCIIIALPFFTPDVIAHWTKCSTRTCYLITTLFFRESRLEATESWAGITSRTNITDVVVSLQSIDLPCPHSAVSHPQTWNLPPTWLRILRAMEKTSFASFPIYIFFGGKITFYRSNSDFISLGTNSERKEQTVFDSWCW